MTVKLSSISRSSMRRAILVSARSRAVCWRINGTLPLSLFFSHNMTTAMSPFCIKKGKYTGIVLKATNQPHGVGRLCYADGNRIHEGFWKRGQKEGHGRCLFFPQRDFHEGEYKNNLRHGPGRYQWKDGRSYVGEYANDQRHGEGVFTYPNGDVYRGGFANGVRSGKGRFDFRGKGGSPSYYQGDWQKGTYHGRGVLVWGDDRQTHEGEFQFGRFHGRGIRKVAGCVVQRGHWVQGRFQNSEAEGSSKVGEKAVENRGSEGDGEVPGALPQESGECRDRANGTNVASTTTKDDVPTDVGQEDDRVVGPPPE